MSARSGANTVYESGKDAATFVKSKMDETGFTTTNWVSLQVLKLLAQQSMLLVPLELP